MIGENEDSGPRRFRIVVELSPGGGAVPDSIIRLRQWLKMGLRAFRARVVEAVELPREGDGEGVRDV